MAEDNGQEEENWGDDDYDPFPPNPPSCPPDLGDEQDQRRREIQQQNPLPANWGALATNDPAAGGGRGAILQRSLPANRSRSSQQRSLSNNQNLSSQPGVCRQRFPGQGQSLQSEPPIQNGARINYGLSRQQEPSHQAVIQEQGVVQRSSSVANENRNGVNLNSNLNPLIHRSDGSRRRRFRNYTSVASLNGISVADGLRTTNRLVLTDARMHPPVLQPDWYQDDLCNMCGGHCWLKIKRLNSRGEVYFDFFDCTFCVDSDGFPTGQMPHDGYVRNWGPMARVFTRTLHHNDPWPPMLPPPEVNSSLGPPQLRMNRRKGFAKLQITISDICNRRGLPTVKLEMQALVDENPVTIQVDAPGIIYCPLPPETDALFDSQRSSIAEERQKLETDVQANQKMLADITRITKQQAERKAKLDRWEANRKKVEEAVSARENIVEARERAADIRQEGLHLAENDLHLRADDLVHPINKAEKERLDAYQKTLQAAEDVLKTHSEQLNQKIAVYNDSVHKFKSECEESREQRDNMQTLIDSRVAELFRLEQVYDKKAEELRVLESTPTSIITQSDTTMQHFLKLEAQFQEDVKTANDLLDKKALRLDKKWATFSKAAKEQAQLAKQLGLDQEEVKGRNLAVRQLEAQTARERLSFENERLFFKAERQFSNCFQDSAPALRLRVRVDQGTQTHFAPLREEDCPELNAPLFSPPSSSPAPPQQPLSFFALTPAQQLIEDVQRAGREAAQRLANFSFSSPVSIHQLNGILEEDEDVQLQLSSSSSSEASANSHDDGGNEKGGDV